MRGSAMRVLGLIPARAGSKGVPGKNVRLLAGKPLIQYTIESALAARRLARVVVTTESSDIAELARRLGAEVPFTRPEALARDESPMLPVVLHALAALEAAGDRFDAVCLLQPTCPLRRPEAIDGCIDLLERSGADSVVSVLDVPARYHPRWVFLEQGDGSLAPAIAGALPSRRQDLPPARHRDGSIYVTGRTALLEHGTLYGARMLGWPMDPAQSVNIDDADDWARAERLLAP
jgi:CMP-N,N'-diacetyllegionaminic acid synthase